MILGFIKSRETAKELPPLIAEGLNYLKNTDLYSLKGGRHEIRGDILYAVVSRYRPKEKELCKPESHSQYADIQYLAIGEEMIGYSPMSGQNEIECDMLADKDTILYKSVVAETDMKLNPELYAVFFPWDVHRPCCTTGSSSEVLKVVIKVKMADLF